jgi:oxygen-independent coproporphyrinogen-3 oxidase
VPGVVTGLYVHVPFCVRACPYCDFDFVVGRRPALDTYLRGLSVELEVRGLEGDRFSTLYLGGGTPSALGSVGLCRLMALLRERLDLGGVSEATVELNPEHVTGELVATVVELGFTRVSLGVQSFDGEALRVLGRGHEPEEAARAVAACTDAGLATSVDLILGWPGQNPDALRDDLRRVTSCGANHLSVYAFTVEPTTPWPGLVRRGLRRLPDPERQAELLHAAERALVEVGWEHYEISSYARRGARSVHNQLHWTWDDFTGLGPSAWSARYDAHGGVARLGNPRGFRTWIGAAGGGQARDELHGEAAAAEGLWLGLRRLEGVALPDFLRRFPGVDREFVARLAERQLRLGNLEWGRGEVLRLATGRWLWHDAVGADLLRAPRPGS